MKPLFTLLLLIPLFCLSQTTRIYNDCGDFRERANIMDNGVSKDFALAHPNYIQDNATNKGCFNCLNTTNSHGSYNCFNCTNVHLCGELTNCSFCYMSVGMSNCGSIVQCMYLRNSAFLDGFYFTLLNGQVGRLCQEGTCDDCQADCSYPYMEIFDCPYAFLK